MSILYIIKSMQEYKQIAEEYSYHKFSTCLHDMTCKRYRSIVDKYVKLSIDCFDADRESLSQQFAARADMVLAKIDKSTKANKASFTTCAFYKTEADKMVSLIKPEIDELPAFPSKEKLLALFNSIKESY